MYRAFVITCIALIILCLVPVMGVLWSTWVADAHDCVLNEAGRHACVVDGEDMGGLLGGAFLLGWLGIVTLPLAAIVLLVLIVVSVIRALRRRRQ
ncbi:hypothetical protein [Pseudooceanicola onchidii]|uniref:hypothetical protein n=1 Tax=Pseudooceanicola onchidii TaxID=2562279 RepID=UPI0010AA713A|nr:hypothetical protein [Pseudooceanicola onchidii]